MKNLLWLPVGFVILLSACKKNHPATMAVFGTSTTSNITGNSAQINSTITSDGGSAITKRGVCWAVHTGPTVGDSITSDGTGIGSFTSSIAGLNANSTYYVRAYAINAVGTSYGNELSFTTNKGLATVTTTAISGIAPLIAISGGNVVTDGGYSVTDKGVCYSTTPQPTIANFKISNGVGTGTFTDTLQPLASQTLYYVRAYATSSFGTAYGNEISFTASSANTLTDIDGNVYAYITIGTQTWMASNLRVSHYRNGDPITNGLTGFNWSSDTTGAYSFPNGDSANNANYGKLYSVGAVLDSRNIAPAGWHIPSDTEWQALEIYEGMSVADATGNGDRGTIGAKLLIGGSSGLNIQNTGYLYNGSYDGFGVYGPYWSSTPGPGSGAPSLWDRWFNDVSGDPGPVGRFYDGNGYAEAIRCVKD